MNHRQLTTIAALVAAGTIGALATPLIAGAFAGTDYSDSTTFQAARNPERVYDSRQNVRLSAGVPVTIDVPTIPHYFTDNSTGQETVGHVPARSVVVNLTAVTPTADGYLTAWSAGQPQPDVSNLNFQVGVDESNLGVVYVTDGQIQIVASVDTDVIVDLFGQYDQLGVTQLP